MCRMLRACVGLLARERRDEREGDTKRGVTEHDNVYVAVRARVSLSWNFVYVEPLKYYVDS